METSNTFSANLNNLLLQAVQPLIDVFWTVVWDATGSTISVPTTKITTK